jgi:hypothetical protein
MAFMLVHCFWLLNSNSSLSSCVCAFSKLFKPFHLPLSPPFPSGPSLLVAHQLEVRRRPSFSSAWCTPSSRAAAASPTWPFGPDGPPAPQLLPAPRAADPWGPLVINYPAPFSARTPPPPPESDRGTPPRAWPAHQGVRPSLLKPPAALGSPPPVPRRQAREPPQTLARCRRGSPAVAAVSLP